MDPISAVASIDLLMMQTGDTFIKCEYRIDMLMYTLLNSAVYKNKNAPNLLIKDLVKVMNA